MPFRCLWNLFRTLRVLPAPSKCGEHRSQHSVRKVRTAHSRGPSVLCWAVRRGPMGQRVGRLVPPSVRGQGSEDSWLLEPWGMLIELSEEWPAGPRGLHHSISQRKVLGFVFNLWWDRPSIHFLLEGGDFHAWARDSLRVHFTLFL